MEYIQMHRGSFTIENCFGPYPGHTDGGRRNGWVTPLRRNAACEIEHYPACAHDDERGEEISVRGCYRRHAVRCIEKPCKQGDV
jgi:hypothetical protein